MRMVMKAIAVAVPLLILVGAVQASPSQWTVASGGNGHWYDYVEFGTPSELGWNDTAVAAESSQWQGRWGYLTTITSQGENNFITDNIVSPQFSVNAWIGAYQDTSDPAYSEPDGAWKWRAPPHGDWDNALWVYDNWWAGEPNNNINENYAVMHLQTDHYGGWNDVQEPGYNDTVGYVVEYVPEPGTLSLFTFGALLVTTRRR
ncbi:MAG: PEP-CTERM sorting domain-containing protein [bacterium]|nr:PEP-CTERM sorting domain-containing protein [bacterium]